MNAVTEITIEREQSALAIIPAASLPVLIAADTTDILGKLRAEIAGYVPDASTERGRKEINQKKLRIGTAKMDFKRLKDGLLEDAKKQVAGVNAEYKIIETNCDAMRDSIDSVLEAYKQIERDRIAGHEAALARIAVHPDMERATIAELTEAISVRREPEARNWQEFYSRAIQAQDEAVAILLRWKDAAQIREEEAAELNRLRAEQAERDRLAQIEAQRVREQQIAEAATAAAEAKAKREAEEAAAAVQRAREAAERKAAADILAAEQNARQMRELAAKAEADRAAEVARAEAARVAAEAKAKRDQEAAIEAERKRAADAKAAEDAETARRAADKAHRGSINREVLADIMAAMSEHCPENAAWAEKVARSIVTSIAKGQVRHVAVAY